MTEPAESPEVLELAAAAPADGPVRRGRRIWLISGAAVVTILAVVAGTLIALTKTVTITVDGQARSITTLAGSVAGALDAAGLTVAEHDTLAPGSAEPIADGATIAVNRGRLLTLTLDGKQVPVWTTAKTVEAALAELGRNPADYQLSADRSRAIPLDGLALEADTLYDVTVNNRGTISTVPSVSKTVAEFLAAQGVALSPKERVSPALDSVMTADTSVTVITLPTVTVTDGTAAGSAIISDKATVADVLAGAGVTLGAQDVVSVPLDSPLSEGLQIGITRVSTTQATETVVVAQPESQTVSDGKLAVGTTKVTQAGQPGAQTVVYDVVLTNGVESSRTEVSRTTTVEAQATVTHVGTKVAAPTPPPTPSVAATPPSAAVAQPAPEVAAAPEPEETEAPPPAGGNTEVVDGKVYFHDFEYGVNWDGLAKCESGNNPRAINPSGKYTGLFQFDDRTWQGVGGSGRAYDAPADEQLMRAKQLFLARGLQPWACAYAGR